MRIPSVTSVYTQHSSSYAESAGESSSRAARMVYPAVPNTAESYNPRAVKGQMNDYLQKLESSRNSAIQPDVKKEEMRLQSYLIRAQNDKHHLQIGLINISENNGHELKYALRHMENGTRWRTIVNIANDDEPDETPHSVALEAEKRDGKISLVAVDARLSAFTDTDIAGHLTGDNAALTVLYTGAQKTLSGCKIFALHDAKAMADNERAIERVHQQNYQRIDEDDEYDADDADSLAKREFDHVLPADFYRLTTSRGVFNALPASIRDALSDDFRRNLNTRTTYENDGTAEVVTYNTAIEDQRIAFARDALAWLARR